jgi:hypothetical protein
MRGDANSVAACQIWRFTTNNFAANRAPTRRRTLLPCARDVTHSCTAGPEIQHAHLLPPNLTRRASDLHPNNLSNHATAPATTSITAKQINGDMLQEPTRDSRERVLRRAHQRASLRVTPPSDGKSWPTILDRLCPCQRLVANAVAYVGICG